MTPKVESLKRWTKLINLTRITKEKKNHQNQEWKRGYHCRPYKNEKNYKGILTIHDNKLDNLDEMHTFWEDTNYQNWLKMNRKSE